MRSMHELLLRRFIMADLVTLAVDPGKTTGWALSHDNVLTKSGEASFDDFCSLLDDLFNYRRYDGSHDTNRPAEIVAERYVITPRTAKLSQQTTALEVIGILRYVAFLDEIPLTLQTPADAKRFATNDRLEARGWLQRPLAANDHANDAIRHLLTFLVKAKRVPAVLPPASPILDGS